MRQTPYGAPTSGRKAAPFQPAVGKDFGRVEEVEAKTRDFLARLIASVAVTGVGVAGGYGLFTGDHMAVIGAWTVAGPIMGALVAYYFGPQRNDTG